MAERLERPRLLLAAVLEAPIRFYRCFLSPALPRRCKYEPSCSAYALSALRSYGIVRGFILTGWRVLRCNPFSEGGYDPIEAQTLFQSRRGGSRGGGMANRGLRGASRRIANPGHAKGACAEEHLLEVES